MLSGTFSPSVLLQDAGIAGLFVIALELREVKYSLDRDDVA